MIDAKESREGYAGGDQDFRGFFDNELSPILDKHEKSRKKAKLISCVGFGLIAAFAALLLASMKKVDGQIFFIVLAGALLAAIFIHKFASRDFRDNFKSEVVSRIARFANSSISYSPGGGISEGTFNSTRIFRKPDRYSTEDLFRGRIGDTAIEFAEVHAEEKRRSGKNKSWVTLFRGVFFIADFNKDFAGKMVVVPDKAEALLGWVGQALQKANFFREGRLVLLEDAGFEELFAAYATDEQEARYILTPAFMNRLTDFRRRTGVKFSLAFTNSKMYLAFPATDKWEPKLFSSIKDFSLHQEFFEDIVFFIQIVEDLNLNLRIWSKMPDRREQPAAMPDPVSSVL